MAKNKKEAEYELEEGQDPREFMQRLVGGIGPGAEDDEPDDVIEIKFTENTKKKKK